MPNFSATAERLGHEGKSPLYAAIDGCLVAVIAVADPIKPTTHGAIRALHDLGLKVAMITGDNRRMAEAVKRLREGGRKVAFAYNVLLIPAAAGLLYPFTGALLLPMLAAWRLPCEENQMPNLTLPQTGRRIRLALEGRTPLRFQAGQYVRLTIAGAPSRDYSLASLPGEGLIELHVRGVPGGRTSSRILNALRVGDAAEVEGPFGPAFLRESHSAPSSRLPAVRGWRRSNLSARRLSRPVRSGRSMSISAPAPAAAFILRIMSALSHWSIQT